MSAVAVAGFDYAAQPKESAEVCNLCGCIGGAVHTGQPDRYGFAVTLAECLRCGLAYLNPRMTRDAYARFYADHYRPLVSAFHGREINAQTIQPEQREYGERLADLLEPWVPKAAGNLLDVGGSTGVVARILGRRFSVVPTVLDPAPDELAEAEADLYTSPGFIEDFDSEGVVWDVVTLCQTVDHLLDPMAALRKIRALLAPGGVLWVDALDYERTRTIKVDHPYNLTHGTMLAYLARAGFRVLQTSRHGDHVGFVCKEAV